MKKLLLLLVVVLVPAVIMAHSPKKVSAAINPDSKKLKIEVTHPVKDPQKHFVESITVTVDGKEAKTLTFQKQSDKEKQVVEVDIPGITKGSEIVVTAKCSQVGSKKQTIKL